MRPRERSVEMRPARSPPYHFGGDSYRPLATSRSFHDRLPRADCYRPQYDNNRPAPRSREPSDSMENYRRDLWTMRPEPGYRNFSRDRSRSRSASPQSWNRTPNPYSPNISSSGAKRRGSISSSDCNSNTRVEQRKSPEVTKLRSPSHSSIASSRASSRHPPIESNVSSLPLNNIVSVALPKDPIPGPTIVTKTSEPVIIENESVPLASSSSQRLDLSVVNNALSEPRLKHSDNSLNLAVDTQHALPTQPMIIDEPPIAHLRGNHLVVPASPTGMQYFYFFISSRVSLIILNLQLQSGTFEHTLKNKRSISITSIESVPRADVLEMRQGDGERDPYPVQKEHKPPSLSLKIPSPVPDSHRSSGSAQPGSPAPQSTSHPPSPTDSRMDIDTPLTPKSPLVRVTPLRIKEDEDEDVDLAMHEGDVPQPSASSQPHLDSLSIHDLGPPPPIVAEDDRDKYKDLEVIEGDVSQPSTSLLDTNIFDSGPPPMVAEVDENKCEDLDVNEVDISQPSASGRPSSLSPSEFDLEPPPKQYFGSALRSAARANFMESEENDEHRNLRVEPILLENLSLGRCPPHLPAGRSVVQETIERVGWRLNSTSLRFAVLAHYRERQIFLTNKIERLREEYLSLHERWLAHCARLDDTAKPGPPEETAPNTSRITRRSAATLGDAVRSDLEMEQIIASLGNDDLTDPNHLAARNLAVIPDMISVAQGQVKYLYDDTNDLVVEPVKYYAPHTGIHDWTEEEKEIFLDKFATYPKQFGAIAEHLPHKTAAQCVDYYYLHKKTQIDFRRVVSLYAPNKRRRGTRRDKQKGNGLLADIRQHDDEVHRDSSSLPPNGPATRRRRQIIPVVTKSGASRSSLPHLEATPTSTPTPEPDARSTKRRNNSSARVADIVCQDEGDEDSKVSFTYSSLCFLTMTPSIGSGTKAKKERTKDP
jgi:Myb-like DNA-binding domain